MISWIIIGRNWSPNLSQLFVTINSQTAKQENYEIIFVDDYSIDGSIIKLEEYSNKNGYKLLKQPSNLGRAAARNRGIQNATGKWCVFTNSNIYPTSNFIDNYINNIHKTNANIIAGTIKYHCHNDKFFETYLNSRKRGINNYIEYSDVPFHFVLFGNCAINKTILNENQLDESFVKYGGEELEYMWRIKKKHSDLKIIKLNNSVNRDNHPSFMNHCIRIEELGYNMSNILPSSLHRFIIPNYIKKLNFIIPTSISIWICKIIYMISPFFSNLIIKSTLGLCVLHGLKKGKN